MFKLLLNILTYQLAENIPWKIPQTLSRAQYYPYIL